MEQKLIALVQQSWEKVIPLACQAAELFYRNLFAADPSLQALFPGDLQKQGRKLMQMLGVTVGKLNDPAALLALVRDLGVRHLRYGVQPAHYQTVGAALLQTLDQGLGNAFTPAIQAAWRDAYGLLAEVMVAGANAAVDVLPTTSLPMALLKGWLRSQIGDPQVTLTGHTITPLAHEGTNDSTTFYRVELTWQPSIAALEPQTTTWVLKHWQAGGQRDLTLGITQSREVLAWEQGWLHRSALPPGVNVPLIGVWRAPDQRQAWLAMEDVSTELAAYPRIGLSAAQAISRTEAILARLAAFHAHWEAPQRQAELATHTWLRRPESYLWDMAATYAQAIGRNPHPDIPVTASQPPVWDGLSADLAAFLSARPLDERRLWEKLLTDRHSLVEGLAAYPRTLLHSDLDDRNIGLRWPGSASTQSSALDRPDPSVSAGTTLVLIDWEWMALGPAALDVANLILRLPVLITLGMPPGAPLPATVWSSELAEGYFSHYRAAGGRLLNAAGWRQAYGLAVIVQGLVQMPFIHGSLRRVIQGEIPPPPLTGVPEEVIRQRLETGLPIMEQMEQRVVAEARRWLGG